MKLKKLNQKGFGHLEIVLLVVIAVIIGGVGYYVLKVRGDNAENSKAATVFHSIARPKQSDRGMPNSTRVIDPALNGAYQNIAWESKPANNVQNGAAKATYISEPFTLKNGRHYGVCTYIRAMSRDTKVRLTIIKSDGKAAQPDSGYVTGPNSNIPTKNPVWYTYSTGTPAQYFDTYRGCGQFVKVTGSEATMRMQVQVVKGKIRVADVTEVYQLFDDRNQERQGLSASDVPAGINVLTTGEAKQIEAAQDDN